jgi:hypothetical protein
MINQFFLVFFFKKTYQQGKRLAKKCKEVELLERTQQHLRRPAFITTPIRCVINNTR